MRMNNYGQKQKNKNKIRAFHLLIFMASILKRSQPLSCESRKLKIAEKRVLLCSYDKTKFTPWRNFIKFFLLLFFLSNGSCQQQSLKSVIYLKQVHVLPFGLVTASLTP